MLLYISKYSTRSMIYFVFFSGETQDEHEAENKCNREMQDVKVRPLFLLSARIFV
jgi:hypothetical protein